MYTAAEGVAAFLASHAKGARVYVIGTRALRVELRKKKMILTDQNPDYVVFGSGGVYGLKEINKAIEMIVNGAKFITANAEPAALTDRGIQAGSGALIAPIEKVTKSEAYVVGKPNHFMIRLVEEQLDIVPTESIMIGDSLDSDINVGMQAQMKTLLVLSGITSAEDLAKSAYQPDYVFPSVGKIRLNDLP